MDYWKIGGALFGAMILTQAAKPKGVQTVTSDESRKLLGFLEAYRIRNGTPIALQDRAIIPLIARKGKPDAMAVGVKTAAAQVREALSADRFVFADPVSAKATVPSEVPDDVRLYYVSPEAVSMHLYTYPSTVLIAAPKGYLSDGTKISSMMEGAPAPR